MNFILENTFLCEVHWRPLIKFHCLITMLGYYEIPMLAPFSKHLEAIFWAKALYPDTSQHVNDSSLS